VVVKRDQFTRIDNYEDHFVGEGGRVTTIHRLDGRVVNGEDSLRVERSQQVVVEQNVDHAYNGDHFHLVHRGEAGTTLHFDQSVAKWVSKKEILVDNPTGKISLKNNDVLIECKKEQVVLYCGQSIVHVKKDGTIEAYAGKEIKLQSGSAAAVIDHEGKVAVTGSKEVKLAAGDSTMVMTPAEVTVKSGKIKLNA
jgi:hypothetical protein